MPLYFGLPTSTVPAALVVALLLAASAPARSQAAAPAMAECVGIDNDGERLACFDRISGRATRPAAAPKKDPSPAIGAAASHAADTTLAAPDSSGSMYDPAWSFDATTPRYDVTLYAPNYFLFGRYTTALNTAPYDPQGGGVLAPGSELDSTEAAFQLSFKFRLWTTDDRRWGVWAAYSQQSQWQLYNDSGNASRPFRETNYMPELILSHKPGLQWQGVQWNLFNFAFNHQSNGRSDTISRSWNRLITSFGFEHQNLGVLARLWWRIPESSETDDNPTISDYYGWGDLSAIYKWRDQSVSVTVRGNPSTGRGAGQLTWTTVPLLGPLRGYVKIFSGYGETLIDYNWNQSTFGIGLTLNDWL